LEGIIKSSIASGRAACAFDQGRNSVKLVGELHRPLETRSTRELQRPQCYLRSREPVATIRCAFQLRPQRQAEQLLLNASPTVAMSPGTAIQDA
jgi:hypothetical protein